jgi:S1-C subfamily serine protease
MSLIRRYTSNGQTAAMRRANEQIKSPSVVARAVVFSLSTRSENYQVRTLIIAAGVLAFIVASAMAQTSSNNPVSPPPQQEPPKEMMEHWQRATVSFGRKEGAKYTTLGSGVIVAIDEHHGCLLTARHMVDDPEHGWKPRRFKCAWRVAPPIAKTI